MVVIPWLVAIVVLGTWWLWNFDRQESNPFHVARVYRVVVIVFGVILLLQVYKTYSWNRDLRQLILETCR